MPLSADTQLICKSRAYRSEKFTGGEDPLSGSKSKTRAACSDQMLILPRLRVSEQLIAADVAGNMRAYFSRPPRYHYKAVEGDMIQASAWHQVLLGPVYGDVI